MKSTILTYYHGKNYNQIIECAKSLQPEQCDSTEVLCAVGEAYEKNKDFRNAMTWYEAAYSLSKNDEVLGMYLGIAFVLDENALVKSVLEQVDEGARGLYYWAAVYELERKTNDDRELQITALQELQEVQSEPNYLLRLAMLYLEEEREKEAARICKKIIRLFLSGEEVEYAKELQDAIKDGTAATYITERPWVKGNVFKHLSFAENDTAAAVDGGVVQNADTAELGTAVDETAGGLNKDEMEIVQEFLNSCDSGADGEDSAKKGKKNEEKIPAIVESCFEDVVGMRELKLALRDIYNILQLNKKRKGFELSDDIIKNNVIIAGPDGCGKTTAARVLVKALNKFGMVGSEYPQFADYYQLVGNTSDATFENVKHLFEMAADGVVVIENIQEFDDANAYSMGLEAIDLIVKAYHAAAGSIILVVTGTQDGIKEIFEKKKELKCLFLFDPIVLGKYSAEELVQIAKSMAENESYIFSEDAERTLKNKMEQLVSQSDFKYSRDLKNMIVSAIRNAANRLVKKRHVSMTNAMQLLAEDLYFDESSETVEELLEKLNSLIGLNAAKKQVSSIVNAIRIQKDAEEFGVDNQGGHGTLHLVFKGNAGTGKTTVARIMAKIYQRLGVLPKGHMIEVGRTDLVSDVVGGTAKLVSAKIKEAMGGILFIDEAYALCPDDNDTFGKEAVNTLVQEIENHRDALMVIIAGYSSDMDAFLTKNQGLRSRFPKEIIFEDYTPDELCEIFKLTVKNKGYVLNTKLDKEIMALLKKESAKTADFGNARGVRNVVEAVISRQKDRIATIDKEERTKNDYILIRSEDILAGGVAVEEEKSVQDYLDELNSMIGLDSVKKQVGKIINQVKIQKLAEERKLQGQQGNGTLHLVFKGNAGTGKTTVARIIGDIYRTLGVLKRGQLVEVGRSDLVSEYVGGTAKLVNAKVQEALGGILFVDEAYAVCPDDDDKFGKEAIDTLVAAVENHRSEFMVILAGYSDDIDKLLDKNQGLRSRFPGEIIFEDYSLDEMFQIFGHYVSKAGMRLDAGIEDYVMELLKQRSREKDFGNARGVRNVFESVKSNQRDRLAQMPVDMIRDEDFFLIKREDLGEVGQVQGQKTIAEYLAELNDLTGLASVKEKVNSMVATAEVNKRLQEMGLATTDSGTMHMVFKGNAGTGKTTVARIVGGIYRELGVLRSGHLVECDRSSLVAGYQGQTAMKVKAKVQEALGGVLFIDEAYALCEDENDSFGKEALNALVADIENYRKDLMVIIAGYSSDMDRFLAKNQGLVSRFPNEIMFEDYSLEEMVLIFKGMLKKNNLQLAEDAEATLAALIDEKRREDGFGNARGVRNIFDAVQKQKNVRLHRMLMESGTFSAESAQSIMREDIEAIW